MDVCLMIYIMFVSYYDPTIYDYMNPSRS